MNSVALRVGLPSYDDAIADLSGVSVPVQVVLEIFNAEKKSYTSSALDGQCYKAGPACPENHAVCMKPKQTAGKSLACCQISYVCESAFSYYFDE